MRLSRFLLTALAGFSFALCAETKAIKPPRPQVIMVPGQKLEAVWPSGNRAGLFVARNPATSIPTEIQVTENLCTGKSGARVRMQLGMRADMAQWVWTVHQDPTRVGQVLYYPVNGMQIPLTRNLMLSNGSRYINPSLAEGLPQDLMSFEQVDWLPEMSGGVLKELLIESWSAEKMSLNPETGGLQNRVVSGENGMRLVPTGPLTARMNHPYTGGFFFSTPNAYSYLFGDVMSWTLDVNGHSCQISFKPLKLGRGKINEYLQGLKLDYQPYIWKEDSLSETDSNFFENGVNGAAE